MKIGKLAKIVDYTFDSLDEIYERYSDYFASDNFDNERLADVVRFFSLKIRFSCIILIDLSNKLARVEIDL